MLFNWVKEINRLRKEINRLLSKEISNISLKVTIEEKNRGSQSFDFLGFKKFVSFAMSVLGSSNLRRYRWVLKRLGTKLGVGFLLFSFWK